MEFKDPLSDQRSAISRQQKNFFRNPNAECRRLKSKYPHNLYDKQQPVLNLFNGFPGENRYSPR
jgi:hypothetical protein